jgi:hypothetical protein
MQVKKKLFKYKWMAEINGKEHMSKRNRLERKLDEYNHTMELVRTIVPIAVLVLQVIILLRIL